MIKKIIQLSKILIKDYFFNLKVFNKYTKKINVKSVFTWLIIILEGMIIDLSYKAIGWLNDRGESILFFKIYLPIIATIFIFQAILICSNVFFFSKDLEYILPLPIKPKELLIAKFNNVLSMIYGMEALFLAIPLLIYGMIAAKSFIYFFMMILVLIIFPVFLITAVCIVMLFIIQLTKFIKNKDIFQIIIVIVMSSILSIGIIYFLNSTLGDNITNIEISENNESIEILHDKLNKLNNYYIVINPCIKILTDFKFTNILINLLKLILVNIVAFLLFICLGEKLYLKNLLKNIAYINKKKNYKKHLKNKYKKNKIKNAYIKNEFRKLIKNPTFFNQCIFQYIYIIVFLLVIINLCIPMVVENFQKENSINEIGINNFAFQSMCTVIIIIQIIFTFCSLSLTAISRDGKNATIMKYIPVPLYKQFIWKNIPQILLNTFAIIGVTVVMAINIPHISIWYYIVGIVITMILNIINSFIMLIIDLKKPNLNWTTETSVLKDNGNKLYQYVTTILICLVIFYFAKIFEDVNFKVSFSIVIIILSIILFIINKIIKKNINKLFEKIN